MNRLQKKCLIAVAGTHLLLVVLLLCSGFIRPQTKPDDTQVLDVIPAKLIDAAFSSGVRNAPPPPQTPIVKPPEPQSPQPEPPKQPVKTVEPPKPVEPLKKPEVTLPEPEPKPKPQSHKIEVNLKPTVRKPTPTEDNSAAEKKAAEEAAKEAKRVAEAKARAFRNAARTIRENASSSTTIEMVGTGSVSYAPYEAAVKSIYEREWRTPNDAANDEANTRVSVTIRRDGTVISAHILTPSGDAKADASVQQTLDRVTFIAPFPDGATENEKEFIIIFNLKMKRMLG